MIVLPGGGREKKKTNKGPREPSHYLFACFLHCGVHFFQLSAPIQEFGRSLVTRALSLLIFQRVANTALPHWPNGHPAAQHWP